MADEVTRIVLYKCSCDRKCVAKENSLENPTAIKNHFRIKEPCSLLDPIVELTASNVTRAGLDLAQVNYIYIERFNRFYFVNDIIYENDGLVELHCSVDVLMSYADNIYNSQQEVIRSEAVNSKMYIDPERPILTDKILTTKILGEFPETSDNNYIMTVAGGLAVTP